jgi:hypothetical protein
VGFSVQLHLPPSRALTFLTGNSMVRLGSHKLIICGKAYKFS